MSDERVLTVDSPVGPLTLACADGKLRRIDFGASGAEQSPEDPLLCEAARQLSAYFAGTRREFELPLDPGGTPFQAAVWAALAKIPYGETVSYGEIARRVGRPGASRAVGMANHRNPLPIVLPCHRVIGAGGALTGYGGGLPAKQYMLEMEKRAREAELGEV